MTREEAQRAASSHPKAVVAQVARDGDGPLVFKMPDGDWPASGLRLLLPSPVVEGEFVVLVPILDGGEG